MSAEMERDVVNAKARWQKALNVFREATRNRFDQRKIQQAWKAESEAWQEYEKAAKALEAQS